jgi:hypothetical protein
MSDDEGFDQARWIEQAAHADGEDGEDDRAASAAVEKRDESQADILISLAASAALFHTPAPDRDGYAEVVIDGRREVYRIRSKPFRDWLRCGYYKKKERGCNSEAIQTAVETLAAKATFQSPEHPVFIRLAEHEGAIYIDIGDDHRNVVEVTASGWMITNEAPVRFVRPASTRALPIPEHSQGGILLFRHLCNLTDDEFVLLVAHTLAMLRPNSNYPVLVLTGEQGSCKSTLAKLVVKLTDPRLPDRRSLPDGEDNLITAAKGVHVLSFDNISGMPKWLSDAICRLSTGGGAGKRKLYSDDDEILFEGRRPVLLNGIEDVTTSGDLVERSNILSLQVITEDRRLTEAELDAEFELAAPKILGALLDGLVAALKNLPDVEMVEKPRMADFVLFAEAGTRAFYRAGTFTAAYRGNMAASVEMVIEASPVATAVCKFMEARPEWSGTAQELLKLLSELVGEPLNRERGWPKYPNAFSGKLRRAASSLRKIGIDVSTGERQGHDRTRIITITKQPSPKDKGKTSSASSKSSAATPASNKINGSGAEAADDKRRLADDPGSSAPGGSSAGNLLINNDVTDADGADDKIPHSSPCAHCGQPCAEQSWDWLGQKVVLHPHCEGAWADAQRT